MVAVPWSRFVETCGGDCPSSAFSDRESTEHALPGEVTALTCPVAHGPKVLSIGFARYGSPDIFNTDQGNTLPNLTGLEVAAIL